MLKKANELAKTFTMLSAASVSTKLDEVINQAENLASIRIIPVNSANRMILFCSLKAVGVCAKFKNLNEIDYREDTNKHIFIPHF